MRFFAHLRSNITVESGERRKDYQRSLESNVIIRAAFFYSGLQRVQGDVLTSACGIFESAPLYNFHLDQLTLFEKCTFTHLGCDVKLSHQGKSVHERRPFSKMRTSILRAVDSIPTRIERNLSLTGL